jgi:mono/diheme cytochrome c family protein
MTDQRSLSEFGFTSAAVILIGTVCFLGLPPVDARADKVRVEVPLVMPADARKGEEIYNAHCRRCHGDNLSGTDHGPPLILYERGHHGDGMFYQAVRSGVEAHHWTHGDMPPLEKLTKDDIALVIRYVRELQKFNDKNLE